jgi:hypothetical protein
VRLAAGARACASDRDVAAQRGAVARTARTSRRRQTGDRRRALSVWAAAVRHGCGTAARAHGAAVRSVAAAGEGRAPARPVLVAARPAVAWGRTPDRSCPPVRPWAAQAAASRPGRPARGPAACRTPAAGSHALTGSPRHHSVPSIPSCLSGR